LQGNDKWAAYLLPDARLRLERNSASTMLYSSPGANRVMIYARNNDPSAWQAICVLPAGMPVQPNCFGGSGNLVLDVRGTAGIVAGAYVGKVTWWINFGRLEREQGEIKLTATKDQISGSMTFVHPMVRREAVISGKVTADGRIAATVEGKSEWRGQPQPPPDPTTPIMQAMFDFPFRGELTGIISDKHASGSFKARSLPTKLRKPSDIKGTWQASPQ
jgi:hypothetical protein